MRAKYALRNSLLSLLIFILNGIMIFITRTIMLPILGSEIVGLTATFSDVLSFLNFADLGITSAVGATLYDPIQKKNYCEIKGTLNFFKKLYRFCGIIFSSFTVIAAIVLFFIFNNQHITKAEVVIYFLITAASTGLSYFFSYRLIILATDQKMLPLKLVNVLSNVVLTTLKVIVLYTLKSFTIYLVVNFIVTFLYYLLMNYLIKKTYKKVELSQPILKKETKVKIIRSIKGLIYHRVAEIMVFGTNNLYTAIFTGLSNAAKLSNYSIIISLLSGVVSNIFSGFTSSLGNLVASETTKKRYQVFRVMLFANSFAAIACAITFNNSVNIFIKIWIGKEYLLDYKIVCILSIYFFVCAIRPATEQFKTAAGIFYEDRYVPIFEAILNVICCVSLGYKFGVFGVVLGNVLSTVLVISWQKPYMVFKYVFHLKLRYYFFDIIPYVFTGIFAFFVTNKLCGSINLSNLWLTFFINIFISLLVSTLVFILIFIRTQPFKDLFVYIFKMINFKSRT
jgi:O-antigen/teichoic acid export membrane protein